MAEHLQFKGGNPGAVQYGNFINYYKFRSLDDRIKLLPVVWLPVTEPYEAFDIGCNAGVCCKQFMENHFLIYVFL